VIDSRTSERLAREVLAAYEDAEARIAATIARLLAKDIDDDAYSLLWAQRKQLEIVVLRRQVERILGELASATPQQVLAALSDARRHGLEVAKADLTHAGIAFAESVAVNQASVAALAGATTQALGSTHLHVLRSAQDVYREAVAAAARGVVTGTETRRQAAQRVLDRFADRGVTGFVDRTGRAWNLASYAEMAVRSTATKAAVQGQVDSYRGAGRDLIFVSDSPEECELCRPWEGKVLSISGETLGHPTVAEAEAAGLWHPGCTHRANLYTPGLTQPPRVTENPEGYEQRQQQRYLERGIRAWKRREAVALDDVTRAKAQAKVREWQGRMREFIDETDRLRLRYREQIKNAI